MEASIETDESGITENRGGKFTVLASYFNVEKRKVAVFFQFGCKRNVRVLAVKMVEEKRYMIQGSKKKKTVITTPSEFMSLFKSS